MKKILPLTLALLALAVSAQASGGLELRVGATMPSDDNMWEETGVMADIGFVFWNEADTLGFWLGGGVQANTLNWYDEAYSYKTDVTSVPVGASLLLYGQLLPGIGLRGEAGLRYVFQDIATSEDYYDKRYEYDYIDYYGYYTEAADHLELDNTALAVVSLQLEVNLPPFTLGIGGGYQFDLINAEISYDDVVFAETDISGAFAFVNVGVFF